MGTCLHSSDVMVEAERSLRERSESALADDEHPGVFAVVVMTMVSPASMLTPYGRSLNKKGRGVVRSICCHNAPSHGGGNSMSPGDAQ